METVTKSSFKLKLSTIRGEGFRNLFPLLFSLMDLFVHLDEQNRLVLFAVNMVVFAMSIGGYIWLCITLAKTPVIHIFNSRPSIKKFLPVLSKFDVSKIAFRKS